MTENPRRGRQARNFTTNVPKILGLKSSSEQIFFRKLSLGAPVYFTRVSTFLLSRVRTNIYRISRESIFGSTEFSLPSTRFKQL